MSLVSSHRHRRPRVIIVYSGYLFLRVHLRSRMPKTIPGQIRRSATTTKRGLISAAAAVMDGSQKRPRRASGSFCGRRLRCCHLYQNLWVRRHSKPTLRLHDIPCSATVQCFRVVDQEVVQCSCPLGQIFMCYYSFCCYIKLYQRSTWQIGSSSKPGITCIKA